MIEEPNIKRAKMDNLNEKKDSTSPQSSKDKPKRTIINTKTQDFHVIRNMAGFVDHTHFISVFLTIPALAIFAPRRFGKSSHLDMVHKFFQIDIVDNITGCVAPSVNGPPEGRKNYKLFEGTRIITDESYKDLVEEHLGKHPVIRLDFKGAEIKSVEDANAHCREVVHKAYLQHLYLITSKKLVEGSEKMKATARSICEDWCNDKLYQQQNLTPSLENLTKYLYNHFDETEVYILVDEIDAMIASALKKIRNDDKNQKLKDLDDICGMLGKLLSFTKGNDTLVAGTLLTGVSYVAGLGVSEHLNNVINLQFLDDEENGDVVPFYGATTEEVKSLIQKLVENKELPKFENQEEFLNDSKELDASKIMDVVQSRYNGYFNSHGKRIFCLWSVLQYLQKGVAKNYWYSTERLGNLYMLLEIPDVLHKILKLMRQETIEFKRVEKFYPSNLIELSNFLPKENVDNVSLGEIDCDTVFNYLIDQGFLTYPEKDAFKVPGKAQFQLPNQEIREALSDMLKMIVTKHWNRITPSCSNLINDISLSLIKDKKMLQDKMLEIYKAISLIMSSPERKNPLQINEATIACIMYTALSKANLFELFVDSPIKDENGKCITTHRPDFLMRRITDEQFALLWEIKYGASTNKYTTSLYALEEARGKIRTKKGNTKEYLDALRKINLDQVVVIGLSINPQMKVSLAYALGEENQIYFKSETERTSCPDLYKKYEAHLVNFGRE